MENTEDQLSDGDHKNPSSVLNWGTDYDSANLDSVFEPISQKNAATLKQFEIHSMTGLKHQ